MTDWLSSCRIRKVMQHDNNGCGIACVSMVTGEQYPAVRQAFVSNGLGVRKNRPLATNFSELQRGLALHGVQSQRRRWGTWDDIDGLGIVAVDSAYGSSTCWHWIVAERHRTYGIVIHDPDFHLPSFSDQTPPGVVAHPFSEYQPRRSWIRIL